MVYAQFAFLCGHVVYLKELSKHILSYPWLLLRSNQGLLIMIMQALLLVWIAPLCMALVARSTSLSCYLAPSSSTNPEWGDHALQMHLRRRVYFTGRRARWTNSIVTIPPVVRRLPGGANERLPFL
jgi:hypothetical protein